MTDRRETGIQGVSLNITIEEVLSQIVSGDRKEGLRKIKTDKIWKLIDFKGQGERCKEKKESKQVWF